MRSTVIRDWETRDDGAATEAAPEVRAALTELTAAVNGRFDALGRRLDAIEARQNRPGNGGNGGNGATEGQAEEARAAFLDFVRIGAEAMAPERRSLLRVGDDPSAGFLAPDQFIAMVDRDVTLFSPVRQAARVLGMTGPSVIMPRKTGAATSHWVEAEDDPRVQSGMSYGTQKFEAHELAGYVDMTVSALEDTAVSLEAELSTDLALDLGPKEGAAFVAGNSRGKPSGFINDVSVSFTKSGSASTLTADSLIDAYHDLLSPYRPNAVWMMNNDTLKFVRKLKNSQGDFLLLTTPINGTPVNTLMGRPVIEAPDMPDIEAGADPIAFGDFNLGYYIFDRTPLQILRDPFTVRTEGKVRFHYRRRVAGAVRRSQAIRKLRIAA